MTRQPHIRRAGLMVPLFSIPSTRSWGIGEICDLEPLLAWMKAAGQRVLQLLPITETLTHDFSPYGSLSAMAIDSQYVSIDAMEDFEAAGGESGLEPEQRSVLDRVRLSSRVDYRAVRALKHTALRRSFERFRTTEWSGRSARASAFRAFMADQAWWLDEYALFRALHAHFGERAWTEWPESIRFRHGSALDAERGALGGEILFRQYVQWVAAEQWARVRHHASGVALFGDLPFTVSANSADVWSRQDEFSLNGSVGVPPDAFSATGQDWGLPPYRWDVVERQGFEWLRQRGRRMASLFDGCRVDHVVGFYRTFVRATREDEGEFTPPGEPAQLALGEHVMRVLASSGIEIVAEDLGTVPDFVRESLARLSIPGFKVFRWERQWSTPGQPFIDPVEYPDLGVATSGTHDTEPLVEWWTEASPDERQAVLSIPSVRSRLTEEALQHVVTGETMPAEIRHVLLEALFASRADLLILPIQDLFGWRARINQPGTVGDRNWTWRLPWPSDRMPYESEAVAAADRLRTWSASYDR